MPVLHNVPKPPVRRFLPRTHILKPAPATGGGGGGGPLGLAAYSATAFTIGTASTTPTVTSPSFSPAAGDVIYAVCITDDSPSAFTDAAPTNSGTALTWSLVNRDNLFQTGTLAGVASVWRAYNANAQTNITVTYAPGSNSSTPHACISIVGFTGADPVQSGAQSSIRNSSTSSTTITAPSITTSQPGSWVWAVGGDYTSFTTATPGGGMAVQCPAQNPGSGDTIWSQKENPQPASSRASGTSVTVTCTLGASGSSHMVAWEVIPGGGTTFTLPPNPRIIPLTAMQSSIW